ncbi:hypothetical protein K0M31_014384, partial [Melipona bicolor]
MAYQSVPSIPCAFASRCYFTWLVRCDTRHPKTNALRFLALCRVEFIIELDDPNMSRSYNVTADLDH